MKTRRHNRDAKLRLQGIAAALGVLARDHMEPDLADMVLGSLDLTVADLKDALVVPQWPRRPACVVRRLTS